MRTRKSENANDCSTSNFKELYIVAENCYLNQEQTELRDERGELINLKSPSVSTVFMGKHVGYKVFGRSGSQLKLLSADQFTVSYETNKTNYKIRIFISKNDFVPVVESNREYYLNTPSFTVMAKGSISSGALPITVTVSSNEKPRLSVKTALRVVSPRKLFVLNDDFQISADGTSLLRNKCNGRSCPEEHIAPEELPTSFELPALSCHKLNLRSVALCSDKLFRMVDPSDIEVTINPPELVNSNIIKEERLCFSAETLHSQNVKVNYQWNPNKISGKLSKADYGIRTDFDIAVIEPSQLFVCPNLNDCQYYVSDDRRSIIKRIYTQRRIDDLAANSRYKNDCAEVTFEEQKIVDFTEERILTIGAGESFDFNVFAKYSSVSGECWYAINSDYCQLEEIAKDRSGKNFFIPTDTVLLSYGRLSVNGHRDTPIQLAIIPLLDSQQTAHVAGSHSDSHLVARFWLKLVEPDALYLVPHSCLSKFSQGQSFDLAGLEQQCTVGFGEQHLLHFIAHYRDGSVRLVSNECLHHLMTSESCSDDIEKYIDIRNSSRGWGGNATISISGRGYTKQPLQLVTYLNGCSNVKCHFKVSVCKVKDLHLVNESVAQTLAFNDKGQPVTREGKIITVDSEEILDGKGPVSLKFGRNMGIAVLAEYENGCWGLISSNNYIASASTGINMKALPRFVLVSPNKVTPEPAKLKIVLKERRQRKLSSEVFAERESLLDFVVSRFNVTLRLQVQLPRCLSIRVCHYRPTDGTELNLIDNYGYKTIDDNQMTIALDSDEQNNIYRYMVAAIYDTPEGGEEAVILRPNEYIVSTVGAGLSLWTGRNEKSQQADDERYATKDADQDERVRWDMVYFQASKPSRLGKAVVITARLVQKPSISGQLRVIVTG